MTPRIPHFHAFCYNMLVSVRHGLQPAEGALCKKAKDGCHVSCDESTPIPQRSACRIGQLCCAERLRAQASSRVYCCAACTDLDPADGRIAHRRFAAYDCPAHCRPADRHGHPADSDGRGGSHCRTRGCTDSYRTGCPAAGAYLAVAKGANADPRRSPVALLRRSAASSASSRRATMSSSSPTSAQPTTPSSMPPPPTQKWSQPLSSSAWKRGQRCPGHGLSLRRTAPGQLR